ncbi:anaerobic C4-dicarboxylate transporter [Campylobacter sp. RM9344]|uniref:Anaerobic C4-dicarboxylate transporter n=1 Tax=Campylobacter californiensis TaxID=1032243 RepID=A0AAW3ZSP2_9BACT|nr:MULTISPECIES: anaerobic C4-dicarboxylate transporter [unclassified Campylobacter]MBE2984426.1 anaerobic C4-dicarboxylate transporter [Campylobacter sp. RM6883]MBE2985764.1 anaerobic C4-dicarboxylate transporter [Campylobacter sp. RM12919]MBE2987879.1 anaerobic C4-dicarboxylate transporter [Campylobacter sp. RM12920]MBE2995044.1 anaerobic C4-dicarboxylate transporter [Campylobacter sp. RM6913]MBE3021812.1 anaerobic C4-dicarboxylate transporter [Campylobacter sp. 7477a]MBE3028865.1 anaerobic
MEFLTSLSESTQFMLQLVVVLGCLFYGAKKGGMALGILGGIGLIILVFGFKMAPGKPAVDVILTILAVVVASATLQATGGLDVMLQIAEKVLRKHPKFVCILAPVIGWTLTILCGTGHTVYTLLPIIYDVSIKSGVRPERPMAATTISSQMGIVASPVSVAGVSMVAVLLGTGTVHIEGFSSYVDLLKVTIPSTFMGVVMIGIWSIFRGKDLDKDPEFQAKIADPEQRKYIYGSDDVKSLIGVKLPAKQWNSMWIFLAAIAVVAVLGYYKELRPSWTISKDSAVVQIMADKKELKAIAVKDGSISAQAAEFSVAKGKVGASQKAQSVEITNKKGEKESVVRSENGTVTYTNAKGETTEYQNAYINVSSKEKGSKVLGMVDTIQIFMLLAASIMMIYAGIKSSKIAQNEIFHSGMVALVAIYGISWMADTMFHSHIEMLKSSLGAVMVAYPWTYIVVGMLISKFLNSQAAAAATFVPLAVQIGVDPGVIIAFASACYGYFILPTYPSDLAAIQFDRSGTTHIGKYVINHSFIIPGFIGVLTSCAIGYILATAYGFMQ